MYTKNQLEKAIKDKGYVWFENGDYNLNIIGVRTIKMVENKIDKTVTNVFDDYLTLTYKENGEWKTYTWNATTDPGKKSMTTFSNKNGVSILVPGQYRGSHFIRKHNGKYDALCQKGTLKVWRDNNKDYKFDLDKVYTDAQGINIHKAGQDSTWVENWSAGCQVFKRVKDFDQFMKIVKIAEKKYGNSFTYTLLESTDIK